MSEIILVLISITKSRRGVNIYRFDDIHNNTLIVRDKTITGSKATRPDDFPADTAAWYNGKRITIGQFLKNVHAVEMLRKAGVNINISSMKVK